MSTRTAPHPATSRTAICAHRLDVSPELAALVADRSILACEHVVDMLRLALDEAAPGSCCKPAQSDATDGFNRACEHLTRLWTARHYLELAIAKAPIDTPAYPCECNGTGKFYIGGAVVNGVYTGTIGECFRCVGKGWQTDTDRKRNRYYDTHVRRIAV